MTVDIILPVLPGGEACVLRWLVAAGEPLAAGTPLAILLTERAEVLLPAPVAGVLDEPLPVGTLVAPGERLARLLPVAASEPIAKLQQAEDRPRRVTPLARRLAQAHGVALDTLTGTGPGGRVEAADVRALNAGLAQVQKSEPERPIRAEAPVRAQSPLLGADGRLPLATAMVELDISAAMATVAALNASPGRLRLRVELLALVVAAAARLLPTYPELNSVWGGAVALWRRRVHIAVGTPGPTGLRWALVRDAGDLTPKGVARALANGATTTDPATFAIVGLPAGASWQSALPPLPDTCAALSLGAVVRRAVALDAGVAMRSVATLTLSYDARLVDHRRAVAFLRELGAQMERG